MNPQKKNFNIILRKHRSRGGNFGTATRPRLSMYRSNKYIYGQLINDVEGKTLASISSRVVASKKMQKTNAAKEVGKLLAVEALKLGIHSVVLHRGPYRYHGRVAAFADGCREAGLKI